MSQYDSSSESRAVAVIISVYGKDDPDLFDRALQSVVKQDYADGPINIYLCVDGPVSAEIEAVIDRYRASIRCILRNESNLGLAKSLNRLLDALQEEQYVFRMDSDDFSHPNRFRVQIEAMRKNPRIDILGSAINEVDKAGTIHNTIKYPKGDEEIRRYITRRNPLAHPTVCVRRSAIQRFNRYPEVPVNQDWALWFVCLQLGLRISNLDEVLVDMTAAEAFLRRRGGRRAWHEARILAIGIWRLHGFTWRLVFPVLRLLFRLAPHTVIKRLYRSKLR